MLQQHQRKPCPIERRPTMLLKDFLNENSSSSCSSSGFKSFPRKQSPFNPSSPQKNLIEFDPKPTSSNSKNNPTITSKLLRSRSKAASTTISAFQSLMNAVKNIPFTTVKSPSFLPRSLSRRLLQSKFQSSSRKQSQNQVQITVRVKDIMRWTSFRDEMLPPPPPLDYASSPLHCTTSTTITGSTTTTCTTCSSSSNGSSWCDSDFTAEFLPSWVGSNSDPHADEEGGKKYLPCVGKDFMEASTTGTGSCNIASGPQQVEVLLGDEDEQHSPVSVLDCQFGEDEEESFSSTFGQSLANVGDEDEEMAMELLNYVKATSSSPDSCEEGHLEDKLLLDFFREEMSVQRNQTDDGFQWEMVSKAKAWVSGEHNELERRLDHKKEACVRDMHKGGRWNKFEYEQEELALEIETAMSDFLMEELLVDLLSR